MSLYHVIVYNVIASELRAAKGAVGWPSCGQQRWRNHSGCVLERSCTVSGRCHGCLVLYLFDASHVMIDRHAVVPYALLRTAQNDNLPTSGQMKGEEGVAGGSRNIIIILIIIIDITTTTTTTTTTNDNNNNSNNILIIILITIYNRI